MAAGAGSLRLNAPTDGALTLAVRARADSEAPAPSTTAPCASHLSAHHRRPTRCRRRCEISSCGFPGRIPPRGRAASLWMTRPRPVGAASRLWSQLASPASTLSPRRCFLVRTLAVARIRSPPLASDARAAAGRREHALGCPALLRPEIPAPELFPQAHAAPQEARRCGDADQRPEEEQLL